MSKWVVFMTRNFRLRYWTLFWPKYPVWAAAGAAVAVMIRAAAIAASARRVMKPSTRASIKSATRLPVGTAALDGIRSGSAEPNPDEVRLLMRAQPACPAGGLVPRRQLIGFACAVALLAGVPASRAAQSDTAPSSPAPAPPPQTSPPPAAAAPTAAAPSSDLDALMARALQKRDVDRRTLSDYVLDEVESVEVLGPGRAPITRIRREYTWYVREGIHVRSPLRFDGVPIPESDRREYEEKWFHREQERRQHRAEREATRASEGKPPTLGPAALNEPRFVSESYFLDFKFEPGNYYLAGRDSLDKHDVLKIDYYPTHLFSDDDEPRPGASGSKEYKHQRKRSEEDLEQDLDRKMNK